MSEATITDGVTGPDAPAPAPKPGDRPEGLPENFDSVEALVASYKEAQAKLTASGQQNGETEPKPTEGEGKGDAGSEGEGDLEASPENVLPENLAPFSEEFAKDGKLSEDSYTKLTELGYSKGMVDAYIKGVTGGEAVVLSEADVTAIKVSVGGEEDFATMQKWAGENLTDAELETYNAGISSKATAQMSVDWLAGKMKSVEGFEATKKVEGANNSADTIKPISSTAELTRLMSDPLYKSGDKAYHAMVDARLAKSSMFGVK